MSCDVGEVTERLENILLPIGIGSYKKREVIYGKERKKLRNSCNFKEIFFSVFNINSLLSALVSSNHLVLDLPLGIF